MQGWGLPQKRLPSRGIALSALLALPLLGTPFTSLGREDGAPPPSAAALPAARVASLSVIGDDIHSSAPQPVGPDGWVDPEAGLGITLPTGWTLAPASSLNPVSDPPEPTFERARFQLKVTDPTLYSVPVPVTNALVRDAGAIISISLARQGTDLAGFDADKVIDAAGVAQLKGFTVTEEESVYEDIHILARYFASKSGERVVVVRVYALDEEWAAVAPAVRTALGTIKADPDGANAEPPPAPVAKPEPEPAAPAVIVDPTVEVRNRLLARAATLLGVPYIWGGNSTTRGMDCSAYVSWVWGVQRYTTDSIWAVSHFISKEELRPGDAMNLTIGRDPRRAGHIRMFEAWANEAHTLMWVYEETPPRVVHRVIAYDSMYQPIRLNGLSGAGASGVIAAPPSVIERVNPAPAQRTQTPSTNTQRRTATPPPVRTPTPTVRVTPRPLPTTPAPVYVDPRSGQVIGGNGKPPPMLVIGTPTPRPTAAPTSRIISTLIPTRAPTAPPSTPAPTPKA